MLVTRGSDGMALFEPGRAPLHIPIHGTDEVADVTGAGDTVIATFTLALAAGATPAEAAHLANFAGGIVVMKHATATVSAEELLARRPRGRAEVREAAGKVAPLEAVRERIEAARREGKTVALANGCFDVLHVGHVRYLEGASGGGGRARGRGQRRCLGAAAEGPGAAGDAGGRTAPCSWPPCAAVDHVVVFEEDDVARLLRTLRPDVHCKGTDYTPETVPEKDVVRSYGGRVAIVGDPKDHDTRALLARIRG